MGWLVGRLVGQSLAILGQEDGPLPTAFGVCMAVQGVLWGPLGSQMANQCPPGMDEVG